MTAPIRSPRAPLRPSERRTCDGRRSADGGRDRHPPSKEKTLRRRPPTCSNADRRSITQAPDTQSTCTGSDARDQSRLRFESQLSGAILVRKLMRPPRPVVTSGNRRADGCTLPSAFRMRGPTTATSWCSSSQDARVSVSPGRAIVSGFSRRRYRPVVSRAPRFTPAAKPSFRGFSMSVMFADCDFTAAARAESPS